MLLHRLERESARGSQGFLLNYWEFISKYALVLRRGSIRRSDRTVVAKRVRYGDRSGCDNCGSAAVIEYS